LRRVRSLIGAVLSVAVLIAVLATTDLGPAVGALATVTPLRIAAGLGLLLIRDILADVSLWRSALAWAGFRVRYRDLLRVYVEFTPLKFLLPFKLGDAARVVALRTRLGVPAAWGGATRLVAMAAQSAAFVVLAAGLAAMARGTWWPAMLGVAGVVIIAATTVIVLRRRGRSEAPGDGALGGAPTAAVLVRGWPHAAQACAFAILAAGAEIGLFALFVGPALGRSLDPATLAVIAATALACHLPLSARGVGVRELLLTTAVAAVAEGNAATLLGAGLAISAIEIGFVLALAAGFAVFRMIGLVRSSR
jgi:hypothetical protein